MEIPEHPWTLQAAKLKKALDVSVDEGLSDREVKERRDRFGWNRLQVRERRGLLAILWNQLESLIVLLLAVAGGVALAFGDVAEAVAIGGVLVVNTAIGFWMELRAMRSMESLRKMGQAGARVRRNGATRTVAARELVPGDVVLLSEGDVVTADLRLIEAEGLQVDESSLTGESVPVDKETEALEESVPLADRSCMVYRGTTVRRGRGTGIVAKTGMDTELGAISSMVGDENDESPLDARLDRLGRKLVWLTVVVAGVVVAAGILAGRNLVMMVQTGIALAVAAIPEGLAIVATVALARGMRRMMKRNALIRHLGAVQTLGSATIICTDKTGTLTLNEMTVRRLTGPAGDMELGRGAHDQGGATDATREDGPLRPLFTAAVLANDAEPGGEDGEGADHGDPMDLALLEMGRASGVSAGDLRADHPRVRTVSFDAETNMMGTVQEDERGYRLAVKGAPEAVLKASDEACRAEGERMGIDERFKQEWLERSEELATEGLRVLAVADRVLEDPDAEPYEHLRFLGLVGFYDPPREDVGPAIRKCQDAGIRVIMATGDHAETAYQIATEVGLRRGDHDELRVAEGRDLSPSEGSTLVDVDAMAEVDVFARVDPEEKLKLVDLHQERGEILAMTGDGVNDAPALRKADIGVAMGQRGTDVAREASDMVLLDDAFSTIVTAVELGRTIFRNMRKFVIYLLSGNVGEILAVGGAAAAGLPLPLLPLQILYLNLVNDVFPALALGIGPGSPNVMERPPRDPSEGIIEARHWWAIVGYGVMIAVVVLTLFLVALNVLELSQAQAVTVAFLGLSTGRLLHAFNMRDHDSPPLRNEITRNKALWGALTLCVGLLAVAVWWDPLAGVLQLVEPGVPELVLAAAGAATILVLGQLWLFAINLRTG
ncbi:MAG: cation-transporting P-type ATPase [Gemmatimonadota bacterium]|nr:cation-transporting P-type ATPase [Gemmatimonadota bacterium]